MARSLLTLLGQGSPPPLQGKLSESPSTAARLVNKCARKDVKHASSRSLASLSDRGAVASGVTARGCHDGRVRVRGGANLGCQESKVVATRMPSMTDLSENLLESLRENADFTLCRGRQHGNPSPVLALLSLWSSLRPRLCGGSRTNTRLQWSRCRIWWPRARFTVPIVSARPTERAHAS